MGALLTGLSETLEVRRQFHLLPSYFTTLFASLSLCESLKQNRITLLVSNRQIISETGPVLGGSGGGGASACTHIDKTNT